MTVALFQVKTFLDFTPNDVIVIRDEMTEAKHSRTNKLANEKSPYLLQHAHNPVEWYSWGEEAFAKAQSENKPIFLSIGYSTCHWCHVMEHESFEDETTAAIMNREFINIKVDREERPDVDRVYMTFVQATTGGGGWPMSVWLTPDLKPFVGGTYFPPEDRYGQPAFKKVLQKIADAWRQNHEKISEQGTKILDALRHSQTGEAAHAHKIDPDMLQTAYEQFDHSFDPREGGFGTAPKFPRPVTLNFLANFHGHDSSGEASEHALEINLLTLRKMAAGGMHDHLGGGFHRYSVDRYWHVPHFEKMLYDQAQLASAYLDAFQITQDRQYADVARDILEYVTRDMTSPEGGFFSAEDADSLVPVAAGPSRTGGSDRRTNESPELTDAHRAPLQKTKEGAFYVWTEKEIDDSLGADSGIFKFHYGVQSHGNAPDGSDPHDEFRGQNILIERHLVTETAARFEKNEEEIRQSLERSRAKLLAIRSQRPRPHRDDKILAGWNGLMISAYARAAQILNDASARNATHSAAGGRYLEAGIRAAKFVRENLYDAKTRLLYRSFRNGRSQIEGFADDYAFVIQALIDLYEASFDIEWLKFAIELQRTQDRLFFDEENGGYFSTSGQDKNVVLRMKDDNDSAEPAASSISALNLLRLAQFYNDPKLDERARRTIEAFAPTLSHFPSAMPQMLVTLMRSLEKPRQIVIASKTDDSGTKALIKEVHRHFIPNKILLLADGSEGQKFFAEKNEAIRAMSPIDGEPAAYICENFACQTPVTDPVGLQALLVSR